ncbi:hypothetical protein BC826DRAFT_968622 [Russula brevipes]|nr:hypothetical protein BC826DRAFT_968622 [Russula brevipes]
MTSEAIKSEDVTWAFLNSELVPFVHSLLGDTKFFRAERRRHYVGSEVVEDPRGSVMPHYPNQYFPLNRLPRAIPARKAQQMGQVVIRRKKANALQLGDNVAINLASATCDDASSSLPYPASLPLETSRTTVERLLLVLVALRGIKNAAVQNDKTILTGGTNKAVSISPKGKSASCAPATSWPTISSSFFLFCSCLAIPVPPHGEIDDGWDHEQRLWLNSTC